MTLSHVRDLLVALVPRLHSPADLQFADGFSARYSCRCCRSALIFSSGETWSSWDIDKHGIQIDFTDSQGVHRSATYVVVLTALPPRLGDSVEFPCLQVFARGCAGAKMDQAAGCGSISHIPLFPLVIFCRKIPGCRLPHQEKRKQRLCECSAVKLSVFASSCIFPFLLQRLRLRCLLP